MVADLRGAHRIMYAQGELTSQNLWSRYVRHFVVGVVVSGVRRMNEVNPLRAQLVPGWVSVFGRVYRPGM